ncbi:MAG: hypothetical protein K2Q12_05150 [Rickettsiales bacterium]|nr:hypothetical protein [Rickettsiales bacterium]
MMMSNKPTPPVQRISFYNAACLARADEILGHLNIADYRHQPDKLSVKIAKAWFAGDIQLAREALKSSALEVAKSEQDGWSVKKRFLHQQMMEEVQRYALWHREAVSNEKKPDLEYWRQTKAYTPTQEQRVLQILEEVGEEKLAALEEEIRSHIHLSADDSFNELVMNAALEVAVNEQKLKCYFTGDELLSELKREIIDHIEITDQLTEENPPAKVIQKSVEYEHQAQVLLSYLNDEHLLQLSRAARPLGGNPLEVIHNMAAEMAIMKEKFDLEHIPHDELSEAIFSYMQRMIMGKCHYQENSVMLRHH